MILIFGGAYQGKLGYVKDNFNVKQHVDFKTMWDIAFAGGSDAGDPCMIMEEVLRGPAEAICGLEIFVAACEKNGIEAAQWFSERQNLWQDKILIIQDQSQGVVPADEHLRAAREMNGRLMIYLAREAEEVHRLFCGIGKRIK